MGKILTFCTHVERLFSLQCTDVTYRHVLLPSQHLVQIDAGFVRCNAEIWRVVRAVRPRHVT